MKAGLGAISKLISTGVDSKGQKDASSSRDAQHRDARPECVPPRTVAMSISMPRLDQPVAVTPLRIIGRTLLLFLLVPAVIFDRDGRGMHDRLTDTAVVRG